MDKTLFPFQRLKAASTMPGMKTSAGKWVKKFGFRGWINPGMPRPDPVDLWELGSGSFFQGGKKIVFLEMVEKSSGKKKNLLFSGICCGLTPSAGQQAGKMREKLREWEKDGKTSGKVGKGPGKPQEKREKDGENLSGEKSVFLKNSGINEPRLDKFGCLAVKIGMGMSQGCTGGTNHCEIRTKQNSSKIFHHSKEVSSFFFPV